MTSSVTTFCRSRSAKNTVSSPVTAGPAASHHAWSGKSRSVTASDRIRQMSAPRCAIVVTTIFEPAFLDGYIDDQKRHGRGDTDLIVIVDRKTPPAMAQRCAELARSGYRVVCPTLEEQEAFLGRFPTMAHRIPYDSDNRRNIGFLMALDRGAEVLISIDDDNYCLEDSDFTGEHSIVG